MFTYMRSVRRKLKSQDGASAVEYGLLVAAIAAVIVVIVFALGKLINGKISDACNQIASNGQQTNATCPAPNQPANQQQPAGG